MYRASARRATLFAGLIALIVLPGCEASTPAAQSEPFQRATNLGAAYLENKDAARAVAAFEQAAAVAPDSALAQRNLARAQLLARDAEKLEEALQRARALEPDAAATAYLSGLALARTSRFDEAVPYFEAAARLDPTTAAIRFQLAGAYQTVGRHADAIAQLEETIRLEPLHLAAHYRLAGQARRAGDDEALQRLQLEITRLRSVLGEEDRSPEALEVCVHTQPELPGTAARPADGPPPDVHFEPATGLTAGLARMRHAAVLELDEGGRYSLVAIGDEGVLKVWRIEDGPRVTEVSSGPALPEAVFEGAPLRLVVGNFYDAVPEGVRYDAAVHARNDLLVASPGGVALFQRRGDGGFDDVTEPAGLGDVSGRDARWLDYDHDGDLDLAIGGTEGVALWQNGGDGRFDDVTEVAGLDPGNAATDLTAVDLTSDGAIDLVVAGSPEPTRVFEGQRTGQLARQLEPPGPWPSARSVHVDDLDGDGAPDVLLVDDAQVQVMPATGGPPRQLELNGFVPTGAVLIDYDADGHLDVLLAGSPAGRDRSALRLLRNDGWGGFRDVTGDAGLEGMDLPTVDGLQAADLDADGDADLLLATVDGVRVLQNLGSGGRVLRLRLQGMKTNPSGFGVRVALRGPGFRATRFVQDVPIEIGLGGRTALDAMQTLWTNGVVDNQIEIEVGADPITVVEQNVAAGSCPYLYAWDGEDFRFVTDLLGNAPIGLSQRRGVPLPADPDEIVRVGSAATLPQRDGAYVLQVTDELREVVYLDQARLIAVDHPRDVEVHPTDRLMEPPFPASEVWALGSPRVPRSALGDDGVDRTAAVAAIDERFAPPGTPLPPPLRGKTRELILTLDFGPLDDATDPVLALTGWLQYGDASRNIALSQNRSVAVVPPTLEMETSRGEWQPVDVVVGMPAGKTKTILVDLRGRLSPGVTRLRLRTTFELRWDRIALLSRLADSAVETRRLEPTHAHLAVRGFSAIRARAPGHPTTPRHADLLDAPPWETTPTGFVTKLGDVLALMTARDDQLVVMNGGDALQLAFDATLPEPAAGIERTFFFYSVGWDKDEDYNVIDGTSVEPLPVSTAAAEGQQARWHTRFIPRDAPARWSDR